MSSIPIERTDDKHEETVYERLGEFHDLFMEPHWERLRPHLHEAFGCLGEAAVIAEIGAGTGLGIRTLATVSEARIWALEPSLVMRATLTARIADDPILYQRVTIVAGAAPESLRQLPDEIDGVVCANMLGHLEADERQALFAWFDERLTMTGTCFVTTQEPATGPVPNVYDSEISEARTIGAYEYRATYLENADSDFFATRYEVWNGRTLMRAETFTGRWQVLATRQLEEELATTGLAVRALAPGIALIHRA